MPTGCIWNRKEDNPILNETQLSDNELTALHQLNIAVDMAYYESQLFDPYKP